MKIRIFIWYDEPRYSLSMWASASRRHIDSHSERKESNYIIFNHRFKQYRKNFKCTKYQLAVIIKKAKTMNGGVFTNLTI